MPTSVLVVDDDEIVCKQMVSYLIEAGVSKVDFAHDGSDAWKKISANVYDCFIIDWKLPRVSGLALFNRIRRLRRYSTSPLLVVSGLINRDDFRMLLEFPCTGLVEKPFTKAMFLKNVTERYAESLWFSENEDIMISLFNAVQSDPGKAIILMMKSILPEAPNPIPLVVGAAKKLRENGALGAAAKVLKKILEMEPRNIQAMMEIGKVLHFMGRHREALNFLKEANMLAPHNIGRLCLMGDAELNLCSPEIAKSYFTQALGIDEQDMKAQMGVDVSQDLQSVLEKPEHDHIPRSFASLMNIVGITLVRSGKFANGLEKYKNALKFLPATEKSARVAFNLGLGYLRWGKPVEALEWFQKSEKLGAGKFGKSSRYVLKLQMAEREMRRGADASRIVQDLARAAEEDLAEESIAAGDKASSSVGADIPKSDNAVVDVTIQNTVDEEPEIGGNITTNLAA